MWIDQYGLCIECNQYHSKYQDCPWKPVNPSQIITFPYKSNNTIVLGLESYTTEQLLNELKKRKEKQVEKVQELKKELEILEKLEKVLGETK